jgi:fructose-bisphosphate aldolase, class I
MLNEYEVMIDAILLKPNMILPGLDAPVASPEEVAKYTVRTMLRSIPPAVPGIHFLSGGMSEEESTTNLQVCAYVESSEIALESTRCICMYVA